MEIGESRKALINLLKRAYSGERAAILAYDGHGRSCWKFEEMKEIMKIQDDELRHRRRVKEILTELGSRPDKFREIRMWVIGKAVGISCMIGAFLPFGWFFAMYGAGKLEANNILEYEHAAMHAYEAGINHFVPDLLEMSETEWDHEKYFHDKIRSHWLYEYVPVWKIPQPKEELKTFLTKAREA